MHLAYWSSSMALNSIIVYHSKCEHSIKFILKCVLRCEKLGSRFSCQSLQLLINTIIHR